MDHGSILRDVRVACGLSPDDSSFDDELVLHTNSFLFRASQFGVGKKGFFIATEDEEWNDFVPDGFENVESLKTYVGLSVRLLFDPPESSSVQAAMKETIKEMEWCLYIENDIAE